MRKIISLILCASFPSFARAADFSADARGTTGAQFLELPAGARAIAMGTAYSSISGDPFSAYYNPAGLAGIDRFSAGLMHAVYFQDISYEYGVLAAPVKQLGVIAVSAQYLSISKLAEMDKTGIPTGDSFSPKDMALSGIYAKQFGGIDLGFSAKYIRSQILNTATAFAGDIGLQTKVGKYAFGLSVLNLGKGLKFHDEESSLPTTGRIGGSVLLNPKWLISIDGIAPKGAGPLAAIGTEYKLVSGERTTVAIRAGYNSRYASSNLGGIAGINAGAGLDLGDINIDYAWSLYGDLGSTHRFSLSLKLPELSNADSGSNKNAVDVVKNDNTPAVSTITIAIVGKKVPGSDVDAWLRQLKSPNWEERRRAAFELGKIKSAAAVTPLLRLLDDENDKVCGIAALALGRIGDSQAFLPLIEKLEGRSADVRASAAKALGDLGDNRAIEPLKNALDDDSAKVRDLAEEALQKLDGLE